MPRGVIKFDEFALDRDRYELLRAGNPIKLEKLPMELLILLVEKDGHLVTRQEIVERLWGPGVFLDTEHGINTAIRKIRNALRDNPEQSRFVQTVTGKGYRFIAATSTLPAANGNGNGALAARAGPDLRILSPESSDRTISTAPASGPLGRFGLRIARLLLLAAIATAALLVGLNVDGLRNRLLNRTPPARIHSLAVLPLENLSGDPAQDYFADGMTDELITMLAKNSGVRVISRTSAMQYKNAHKPLPDIARELGVDGILEGSVGRSGGRVHVNVQLVYAPSDTHVWAESYDRDLSDVSALQNDLARTIARQIGLALSVSSPPLRRINSEGANVDAYNAYLQGRYFFERRSKENMEKAVGYYEQALKLDSGYAPAWAGLAETRSRQADQGYLPLEEGYWKAREAAERALALDANLAEAHAVMGWIKRSYYDWAGADVSFQRALALEPGNATIVSRAAELTADLGRFEEALAQDRRAVEMDPLSVSTRIILGDHAYHSGRLEEAAAAFKKALELNPERPFSHVGLGMVYVVQAHPQEAVAEMEQEPEAFWRLFGQALAYQALGRKKESDAALAEYVAKFHVEGAYQIAELYAFRGEADRAFEWLERAYAQRDGGLPEIKGEPLLKNLEHDPRYAVFLKKMRLPL